ncbi:MAG: NADH-quinone oxidoreductase subunit C [Actinomycetia bacterium]|nr:NADH-quinone oxidoreductase subunit C [Actinomycetes bacterium]
MAEETTSTDEETPEEPPRDDRREEILGQVVEAMGDAVVGSHIDPGRDLWVRVATGAWGEAAEVMRNRMGCRYFGYLSAIDWMPSPYGRSMDSEVDNALGTGQSADQEEAPAGIVQGVAGGESRFQMLARVATIGTPGDHWGITLKADVADDDMRMPTWTGVYAGADWHERECWEMFGIEFIGHPGLRHIYLPGDFEGNPLRKDYPLVARMVKPWPGIVDVETLPETDQDSAGAPDDEGAES